LISGSTLRANLVAAMRTIGPLVNLVNGDVDNIIEYKPESMGNDLFATIAKLNPPRVLVIFSGMTNAARQELFKQNFRLVLRLRGDPNEFLSQFVDGVPSGSGGLKLLYHEIHTLYHSMNTPSMDLRSIPLSAESSFDYWEITTSFTSKGVD
jgi:hypothetical protein